MSIATLAKTSLSSLPIRTVTTGGASVRTIGGIDITGPDKPGPTLLQRLQRLTGFIFPILSPVLGAVAQTVVSLFVQATNFVMNFNWNATDKELDARLKQDMARLGGLVGGTLGNAFGWLLCGVVPGLVIYKFNPLLGLKVLKDVGEEGLEELAFNLATLVRSVLASAATRIVIESYKGMRRFLKAWANDQANIPLGANVNAGLKFLEVLVPGIKGKIKRWGEEGSKPWTFAKARDELIEKLPDGFIEEFAEEFVEETWDACVEALYVVAADVDQWMLEQQIEKEFKNGPEEVVEIRPNRENEEEKIVLAGPQELIKPIIAQTMVQHQMLDERDLGLWVGEPLRKTMIAPPFPIMLRVILSDREGILNGAKRVQITVPDVKREKLGWNDIKAAVGGPNGYMWGPWRTNARLDGGSEIHVYTASEQEGLDLITRMAIFSQQEIVGITSVRERREGARRRLDTLQKQPTRIYPYGFTILNQQKVLNEEAGTATLSGVYQRRKTSIIPLWTDTQPDGYSELIAELFRSPGADV